MFACDGVIELLFDWGWGLFALAVLLIWAVEDKWSSKKEK